MNTPVRPPSARGSLALFLSAALATLAGSLSAQTYNITQGVTGYQASATGTHILAASGTVTDITGPAILTSVPGVELQIGANALVHSSGTHGVFFNGYGVGSTLYNAGTISSDNAASYGIRAIGVALISNTTGGVIQGAGGVWLSNGGTVLNSGTIIGLDNGADGDSGVYGFNSILIDNKADGVIRSANRGVWLYAGGTVLNAGAITSTGTFGILSNAVNTVIDNAATGHISGSHVGVRLMNGGTLYNAGTISGGNLSANYGVLSGTNAAFISNTTGGVIEGSGGVSLRAGGTVVNSGTIIGYDDGFNNDNGVYGGVSMLIDNKEGGVIRSNNRAVYLSYGGTVLNSGSITSTGSVGLESNTVDTVINNAATGHISGTTIGVRLNRGGEIVNSGKIEGENSTGVEAVSAVVTITNSTSAQITGGIYGVNLMNGGTVTNAGTIEGSTGYGVFTSTNSSFVDNIADGMISGAGGVSLRNGGTVRNAGTITGNNTGGATNSAINGDAGIFVDNLQNGVIQSGYRAVYLATGGGTVKNAGKIISTGSFGVESTVADTLIDNLSTGLIEAADSGVRLVKGGVVTNTGTISGTGALGVGVWSASASALVSNSGTGLITGGPGGTGVYLMSGGTVTNTGTISGIGALGVGVRSGSANTLVSNTNTGLITGDTGVYLEQGGTVLNSGAIRGAVDGIMFENASGLVVNSGLVEGTGNDAVNFLQGGTAQNTGTIQGAHGVYAQNTAAVVENDAGALIRATEQNAVTLQAGGRVDNSGTLSSANKHAVRVDGGLAVVNNATTGVIDNGIYAGGTTTVDNRGLVTGALGVQIGASSTLVNTGTIDVTGTALIFKGHADYTNGSLIRGGDEGVHFETTGSLGNTGTIIGTNGIGVVGGTGAILVNNAANGLIQGGTHGVYLTAGGTVSNSGTITGGDAGYGVYVNGGEAAITNNTGGVINAGIYAGGTSSVDNRGIVTGTQGIVIGVSSTLINAGTITAVTGTGLAFLSHADYTVTTPIDATHVGVSFASTGSLGNTTSIRGVADAGVEALGAAITVNNAASGVITGGSYGINLVHGGTVFNSGSIVAITAINNFGVYSKDNATLVSNTTGGVITARTGIRLDAGGTVANAGAIRGSTSSGVQSKDNATLVSNTTGGSISGNTAVWLDAGGTVANAGTIRSTNNFGVYSNSNATQVTNNAGGLIQGVNAGVSLNAGGTITNFGTITGGSKLGVSSSSNATQVTNNAGGLIQGVNAGVSLNAGGTVENSGSIVGISYGVSSGSNATLVTNTTGGYITGATGVGLSAGGTIENSGSIVGSSYGVSSGNNATLVTNNAGGSIFGNTGVSLNAGGTIENSGTIRGGAGGTNYGVYSNNNATLVTNNAGGDITAGTGIKLAQGGTVTNSGTIIGTFGHGINVAGAVADITNNALIEGGVAGITLEAGGSVHNTNNAIIRGTAAGSHGIMASNVPVEIRNDQYATISGGTTGVTLDAGGTITNTGRIEGRDPASGVGVYGGPNGETTVTNDYYASIITGGSAGVWLTGGGTVANTGTIIGTGAGSYGVRTDGGAVDITNDTRGLIRGEAAGAYLAGGGMVTNVGLIEGGIHGMELDGGATITNSGTIYGLAGDGIRTGAGPEIKITNNPGGFISGQEYGVNAASDLNLVNHGVITGTNNDGVYSQGRADIDNEGFIQGMDKGVNLDGSTNARDSKLVNSGTIRVDNGEAVYVTQDTAEITNSGLIEGEYGIRAEGFNISTLVTNAAGGWIQGYNNAGVSLQSGTVDNAGEIHGIFGVIINGPEALVENKLGGYINGGDTGVNLVQGGTVINAGEIHGNDGVRIETLEAYVENKPGGWIHGFNTGVRLMQGGTIINSGTIEGGYGIDAGGAAVVENTGGVITGDVAVNLAAGGTVTNSGLIEGANIGVQTDAAGTVTNSGTILGNTSFGIQADAAVKIENTAVTGLIQGGETGVRLNVGGTVTNSGTILGDTDTGIYADTGVTVVENTGGQIQGGLNGVWLGEGGRVRNTGAITGTASYGIYSGTNAEVENIDGYIKGGTTGVHIAGSSTITNSGTIIGTGSAGIYSKDIAELANTGGRVEGGKYGVQLAAGGAVTNAGTIIGTDLVGIYSSSNATLVTNEATGLISGGTIGVHLAGGGTVANAGTIRGTDLVGIYSGSLATIINNATGLISGGTVGVHLAGGGTVKNTGTISVTNINAGSLSNPSPHAGILVETRGAEIINTGLVQGYSGITIRAGGTLVNSGTIAGVGTAGSGVFGKYTVVATNTIGGVITGTIYALNLPDNASSIVNLWNSSTLAGSLRIEGVSAQLTLNGDAGTEQLYSDAVTGDTDFTGILIKQGAGTWTIDKNLNTNPLAQMRQKLTRVDAGKLIVDWEKHTLNNAAVNIAAGAILEVRTANTATTTTLVNPLTGDGLLDLVGTATVNAPNVTFALSSSMGSAFSGTVGVGSAYGHKTVFDLATSETALENATLKLNANSETTLDANREIGGLDLAGGTFLVKTDTTTAGLPPYRLDVDNLMSTAGGSKIGVDTETLSGINPPLPPGDGLNQNVFDMDVIPPDTLLSGTIVHGANSTIIDGATFDMVDSDGNILPSGTSTISFGQNGLYPVGVNSYGYNAIHKTNGSGGGDIVLNYGLISIESVHATELIILDPTGSLDKTLSAKLTGSGAGFEFRGSEAITLAHSGNDYTGTTLINESAWIIGGVVDVIASSTKVTLATVDTGFDLGGNDQRLQNLNGLGNIRLGDKTLTVANTETGLELSGVIDGTGNVTLADDSEWTLLGANTYTGVTTIGSGAQLQLGNGGATGMIADASAVANTGTLTINRRDDLVYGGTVTGAGVFIQRGAGTTILTGANKIDGGLVVENGALMIGQDDETGWYSSTIAANVRVDENAGIIFNRSDEVTYDGVISGSGAVATIGSGTLAIKNAQTYEGETYVIGSTLRLDTTNAIERSEGVVLFGGTLDLNNNNQRIQNLHAANGVIRYSTNSGTATAYTNLTVAGELNGTTTHYMNVDLVGKKSDTLTVAGLASGTHYVHFDPTTDPSLLSDPQRKYALEVVKLGAGSTAEFDSDGVESGMHTYKLYKGDGGLVMPNGDSYYLSGGDALSRAADAILLTAGVMGADWHYGLDNVHKRLGEIRVNLPTSSGNVWARVNNYRLNAAPDLAGSSFEQDSYGLTAGGDMIMRREKAMLVAGAFFG
ncbi:hypothetical protein M2447_001613, partial [Ereboglobus sp. PH5-10]|uniref:hypothetical protein n=1 Tax=Ereboglobus sp. PH5-10 TaxID=2940629 RepID=UPI002406371E